MTDHFDADQLRMEMRMLEKEVTRSGYTKYHAPDSGFDDSVDALALAYRGLENVEASSATAEMHEEEWDGGRTNNLNDVAKSIARDRKKARKGWK